MTPSFANIDPVVDQRVLLSQNVLSQLRNLVGESLFVFTRARRTRRFDYSRPGGASDSICPKYRWYASSTFSLIAIRTPSS